MEEKQKRSQSHNLVVHASASLSLSFFLFSQNVLEPENKNSFYQPGFFNWRTNERTNERWCDWDWLAGWQSHRKNGTSTEWGERK